MLLGTSIIATDYGGNPEAIDHGITGFLVDAERPGAVVEPLHDLLTGEELTHKISAAARSSALIKYGVSIHVEKLTEIYESLI